MSPIALIGRLVMMVSILLVVLWCSPLTHQKLRQEVQAMIAFPVQRTGLGGAKHVELQPLFGLVLLGTLMASLLALGCLPPMVMGQLGHLHLEAALMAVLMGRLERAMKVTLNWMQCLRPAMQARSAVDGLVRQELIACQRSGFGASTLANF